MDGQMLFQTLHQSKSANNPIQLNKSDETNCFPVKGSEVNIVTSEGDHDLPPFTMTNHSTSNVNQLAEAASKTTLLSPDQFQLPRSTRPDLVIEESNNSNLPSPPLKQTEFSPAPAPHNLEPSHSLEKPIRRFRKRRSIGDLAKRRQRLQTYQERKASNNPKEEVGQYQDKEKVEKDEEKKSPVDRTFQGMDHSSSPTSVKLNHPEVFPTPPAVPQKAMALPNEMYSMGLAIMGQIKQENDGVTAGMKTRLEDAMMKRLDRMEQRLEEVAHSRKVQKGMVESALTSSITKRMEQVVIQEMKRMLPSLVSRGMEGVERDIMTKLGGLESRVAKELATSQSREAIGRVVAKSGTEMVDNSYRQAFCQQAAGFERAIGSMLQEVSEQFMAGSREYEAALGRRMEGENVGVKNIVAPLASTMQGLAGEFKQMKDTVERMKVEQGIISRKVDYMRTGVSRKEVRDIARMEVVNALDGRNFFMTPQPDVKKIKVQQNIQSLLQAGRLNDAFHTALSQNDLTLVVFTCELLNTTQVFNSATCPLTQSVLLSLIQQLSVDLGEKTEVKHAYLHEALVNLDPENPTTKVHIRTVLCQLEQSLKKYILANLNSKMSRNMKILSMAAGSLLQH